MRIGEMLVAEGRLSREQVGQARQAQKRLGGRLGTALLELGLVEEEVLLQTLGRQRASRTASAGELAAAPDAVVGLIPAKLAERYGIVPFQLKGRTLFVASRDVGDPLKEDEIGFLTSCLVRSCIALEFRIYEALERHYGIHGHPRNVALARRLEARRRGPSGANGEPQGRETTAAARSTGGRPTPSRPASSRPPPSPRASRLPPSPPAAGPRPAPAAKKPPPRFIELDEEDAALLGRSTTDPAWAPTPTPDQPLLLAPTPLPWLARESEDAAAVRDEAATAAATATATAAGTAVESRVAPEVRPTGVELTIEEWLRNAGSELKHAEIRDDIADVLLAFCEPFLRRRLLLIARRGRIVGWRGEGGGVERQRVRSLEIPAGEPSVFLGLTGSDSFWLGGLPALPANQPLIDALGDPAPTECVVLPVALRSRVVCYVYGDNLDAGVSGVPIAQLRRLAAKAGLAFEVCILKNKMRIV